VILSDFLSITGNSRGRLSRQPPFIIEFTRTCLAIVDRCPCRITLSTLSLPTIKSSPSVFMIYNRKYHVSSISMSQEWRTLKPRTKNPLLRMQTFESCLARLTSRSRKMLKWTFLAGLPKSCMALPGKCPYSHSLKVREYVEFNLPMPFRRVVLNALTASPISVDLRSQSPQFYTFADRIMNLYIL
jgi:hypothetical protein